MPDLSTYLWYINWELDSYGALSVGERSLETIMDYAIRQKEHHRENKLIAVYERIDEEE